MHPTHSLSLTLPPPHPTLSESILPNHPSLACCDCGQAGCEEDAGPAAALAGYIKHTHPATRQSINTLQQPWERKRIPPGSASASPLGAQAHPPHWDRPTD